MIDTLSRWRLDDMAGYYAGGAGRVVWRVRAARAASFRDLEIDDFLTRLRGHLTGEHGLDRPSVFPSPATRMLLTSRGEGASGLSFFVGRDELLALGDDAAGFFDWIVVGRRIANFKPVAALDEPAIQVFPGAKAVVAVIDDGIALGHDSFRLPNGTSRIAHSWSMDTQVPAGPQAPLMNRGIELTKAQIDDGLTAHTIGDLVSGHLNEAAFYRTLDLVDFARDSHFETAFRQSHGTHVLSLAAGFGANHPSAAQVPIVAVQLPTRVTEATGGDDIVAELLDALDYIAVTSATIRAAPGGKPLPLIVNFSYGQHGGPHDATGLVATALDDLVGTPGGMPVGNPVRPVRVVLPAGNSNLDRCHAVLDFERDGNARMEETLNWRVLPDDKTSSVVEIWLPEAPGGTDPRDAVDTVTVTAPDGQTRVLAAPDTVATFDRDGQVFGRIEYEPWPMPPGPGGRGAFILMAKPTAHERRRSDLAPHGVWRITVRRGPGSAPILRARIRRDDSLPNYPVRGRQSFFDHPDFVATTAFGAPLGRDPPDTDCPVGRAGTLNSFATGDEGLVIGGFVRSTGALDPFSSGGPTDNANRQRPDAVAVTEESPLALGVMGAGSCCGSMVAMNGTSVAAPQVARWLALSASPALATAADLHALAAARPWDQGARPWGGSGRLDWSIAPELVEHAPRRPGPQR